MWFKLAAANFSAKNLGKMADISNSYSINYNISGFAKTTAPTSVTKGSKISEIILTLQENYEMTGTATLTYGSTSVNATVSGSTYKWTNITPTGSVTITAKATWVGTGEEPEPETPVNPPSGTSTTYYFKDQTNVGYLSGGVYSESANSATTDYIDISSKPKIGYFGRMGYVSGSAFHALEFYDANKTYLPSLSVLGDGKEMTVNLDLSESKYASAKYVRASVSKSSFSTEQFNSWYFVVGSFIEQESSPTLDDVISMFPTLGYLGLDGQPVEASSGAYLTDYIALNGKSNISYKGRMGTIGLNMAFYDSSKKFISGLETIGNGNFITLNINLSDSKYSNAAYVRASISKGTLDEETWLTSSIKVS